MGFQRFPRHYIQVSDTRDDEILSVYRETIAPLYGYVSRCSGGDRSLAEDVTQEAWLRAVRDWRRKGMPDRPLAWLTTVARNLLASHFRRRRSAPLASLSPAELLEALDDGRATRSAEMAAVVCCALARLPAAQAEIMPLLSDKQAGDDAFVLPALPALPDTAVEPSPLVLPGLEETSSGRFTLAIEDTGLIVQGPHGLHLLDIDLLHNGAPHDPWA